MRFVIVLIICLLTYFEALTQVSLPYYSGFDSAAERIGWNQFRLGQDDTFDFGFNGFDTVSDPNSLYHDYPVGGITLTNDWFVSPEFALSNGGSIDSIWINTSGLGTPQIGDTIAIYALYGSNDPELASSKILLASITDSIYSKQSAWEYYTDIDIPASSEPCHIGINYQTVNNWLTIRIDNIYISEANATSLESQDEKQISFYPNPANQVVFINKDEDLQIDKLEVYDYRGILIYRTFNVVDKLDISQFESGLYFIKTYVEREQKIFKILKDK